MRCFVINLQACYTGSWHPSRQQLTPFLERDMMMHLGAKNAIFDILTFEITRVIKKRVIILKNGCMMFSVDAMIFCNKFAR
jgi:hypothetical protein